LLRIPSAHLGIFGFLKEFAHHYNNIFAWFMAMRKKKTDLSKGYQNSKRKLGVTEIIELKFGKKLPYAFLELWLLNYV